MAMRIPTAEMPDIEEEWDPQGLNRFAKDELESFSGDEDPEVKNEPVSSMEEEGRSSDLDRDGLAELEEMEMSLLAEESPLDFAMVSEEE